MSSILKGKTILVVDDEPCLRDIITSELQLLGALTVEAPCGNAAYELFLSRPFDAVVTDIRMPNGNGIELLEKVKALQHMRPVVLVTGFADISLEEAYHKGAAAICPKPFELDALMATIERSVTDELEKWAVDRERIEVSLDVKLGLSDYAAALEGKILNLGRGGMFIALADRIPSADAKIAFDITFQSGKIEAITGKGVVRWARESSAKGLPAGCGVEFLELSDASITQIVTLLESAKTKAFIPIR